MGLSAAQIQQFKIDGYLMLPGIIGAHQLEILRELTRDQLANRTPPFELESEVQYPGAPESTRQPGGDTIRRLLLVYQRDPLFADIARHPEITGAVRQILSCDSVILNPNHHNCVMTKQPAYSSETAWHRDTRYWNFSNKYLINAWIALGDECEANGAMKILPGSHRWEVQEDALDAAQFLKMDHAFNRDRLATERLVPLQAGDVLLFSAHCFHAAGRNTTRQSKLSLVFTYHSPDTEPIDGTHSASRTEIEL